MNKQNATFIKMFNVASIKFPFRINSKVSKLKVEKVLNPPQNPIIIRYLRKLEFSILEEKTYKAKLIIVQAKTLEINVP